MTTNPATLGFRTPVGESARSLAAAWLSKLGPLIGLVLGYAVMVLAQQAA